MVAALYLRIFDLDQGDYCLTFRLQTVSVKLINPITNLMDSRTGQFTFRSYLWYRHRGAKDRLFLSADRERSCGISTVTLQPKKG